ncbi:MAG: hypothetical protein F9K44_12685 [Hyphomicrobiaceae bacterium]|nr:MAG: hypothetical protein F9K44_12685 [Hyphomicrobiaceae bacterium]
MLKLVQTGSLAVWSFAIAFSISLMAMTAGGKIVPLHVLVTATITIFFALSAIYELRNSAAEGARSTDLAALATRYMTLVWIWAAIAIFVTYGLILNWPAWLYCIALLLTGATVCAVFAGRFGVIKSREEAREALSLARVLAIIQIVAMIAVIAGLAFDRPAASRGIDWAAQSILFFGALSLLTISAYALRAPYSRARTAGQIQRAGA